MRFLKTNIAALVLVLIISVTQWMATVTASAVNAEEKEQFSPEALYQQTVETWQRNHSRRLPTSWEVWKKFATTITSKYEVVIGKDGTAATAEGPTAVEIVGAIEEGILTIERIVFQQQQQQESSGNDADDLTRDVSLAVLYREYGRLLLYSSETTTTTTSTTTDRQPIGSRHRCYELAKDPHTLLIGAPERLNEYSKKKQKLMDNENENDKDLLVSLFGSLCRDNAENALRNAISLNASCKEAQALLDEITSTTSSGHTRKPKEFVAELFDSFADDFDEKLTKTLKYRVPQIIGSKVGEIIENNNNNSKEGTQSNNSKKILSFRNVLDAGCGTGLAGRELRNAIDGHNSNNDNDNNARITLIGVDASPKMLQIAGNCTATKGCGLPTKASASKTNGGGGDPRLYDALIDLDLEEMTIENTLMMARTAPAATTTTTTGEQHYGFDLIVAADVFVYFGSLETIMGVFSGLHSNNNKSRRDNIDNDGILVFTCERVSPEQAPLGYDLMPTGRFAHTKDHVLNAAEASGYSLLDYSGIVPRIEQGAAVDGHLFVFAHNTMGVGIAKENWGEL